MKRRVAILISGRGSNMIALVEAAKAANFPAEIAVVISNKTDAAGLARAGAAGIETLVIESKPFGRMLNIHPSLLPSFRGLDPHGQALRAGVKISGATVHFVVAETDAGPIIMQGAVTVRGDDTAETLAARVLEIEHRIYPDALRLVAGGGTRLDGDICNTSAKASLDDSLISPLVI
ncbi:MAG: formyltetrahydrofolate-dependent phosphoribosylglycinamide formyltransferase [Nitrobacter vulgaris]|nr:formyltetrahydrofolate-dependent phosphoribosylglycinamide formyltransferase [Nitrobacter vulgaris]